MSSTVQKVLNTQDDFELFKLVHGPDGFASRTILQAGLRAQLILF
jgi:hypothetical protein